MSLPPSLTTSCPKILDDRSVYVYNQVACLVRVPTENVKQKMQAGLHGTASETVNAILKTGGTRGFYTGYLTTVVREIPFAFIQFPIYEWLKVGPEHVGACSR